MGKVERSIEINAPVEACYAIWTDFERFPRFMKNVRAIRRKGDTVWEWEVAGPLGKNLVWDAEVDGLQPNRSVSWHSVRDADVDNSGAVTFESLGPALTRVNVVMVYNPPAGVAGEFVADIFKNPTKMVEEDLENFRELAENQSGVGTTSRTASASIQTGTGNYEYPSADTEL